MAFVCLAVLGLVVVRGAVGAVAPTASNRSQTRVARAADLLRAFGEHASEAFSETLRVERASDGSIRVATATNDPRASASTLRLSLPARGEDELVLDVGDDTHFRVRELGVSGASETVDGAVSYAHRDGRVYWTTGEGGRGYEEWLDLRAGVAYADREVAAWHVADARLSQVGDAVIVRDPSGRPRMRVSAPRAYDTNGREVTATLRVVEDRIALFVDADGARVLVDPWWETFGIQYMASGRSVPLADGGALVFPGGSDVLRYAPSTDSLTHVAKLPVGVSVFGASLLPSGEVLVVGSAYGPPSVPACLIYDPVADGWSPTAATRSVRDGHVEVTLLDGDVLVLGGTDGSGVGTTEVERFDHTTHAWTVVASMGSVQPEYAATVLSDGRVLVIGASATSGALATSAIYDPSADTWTPTSSIATTCDQPRAVALAGTSDVLVLCQDASALWPGLLHALRYDPIADSWAPRASAPVETEIWYYSATQIPDGRVVVVGDRSGGVFAYDPTMNEWDVPATQAGPRYEHFATRLVDGRVLLTGGDYADASWPDYGVEVFDGTTNTFSGCGLPLAARFRATATLLQDGRVLVAGGTRDGDTRSGPTFDIARAEVFDPMTNRWRAAGDMRFPRHDHTATLLPDGRVLVIGGVSQSNFQIPNEIFDPETNSWSEGAPAPVPMIDEDFIAADTATLLADGRVLVTESRAYGDTRRTGGTRAWVFDPQTNDWSRAARTHAYRVPATTALLPDGRVMLAGSESSSEPVSAEIYDPTTDVWTPVERPSIQTNSFISMVGLLDGRVLLAGYIATGSAGTYAIQTFDPVTGHWSTVPLPPTVAWIPELRLLPTGEVLLLYAGTTNRTLVFDPNTGSFTSAGDDIREYFGPNSIALTNGDVLLIADKEWDVGAQWGLLHLGCASRNGGCDRLSTCDDSTHTIVCGTCPAGTYSSSGRGDVACTPCPAETFVTTAGATACLAATPCASGEYASTPLTTTHDRVCSAVRTCVAGEYEASPPSPSQDRVCAIIRSCTATEFETSPPTSTTDRVCMACTPCAPGTTESQPCTTTTDRTCMPVPDAGATADAGYDVPPVAGCGCTLAGSSSSSNAPLGLGVVAFALVVRARRRRARRG